jgi:uncharacterized protein
VGLIYLDSCICVYSLEHASSFHGDVVAAFAATPDKQIAISHLVLAECFVGPLKSGNSFVIQDYEALFRRLTILDLNEAVFRQAAQIRSRGKLKMPDALHLACAQFHNCDALWTNDDRLSLSSDGLATSIVAGSLKR